MRVIAGTFGLLAATGLMLGVIGCGGGGGRDGTYSDDPIRFWHAMGGPLGRSLNGLVGDFTSAGHEFESVLDAKEFELVEVKRLFRDPTQDAISFGAHRIEFGLDGI